MAKAIKYAALAVGAVALIATGVGAVALGGLAGSLAVAGVSTSTLFLVAGGLSVAASLLQKGPKVPASQTDRLSANIDPRAFRKTWLGQTAAPIDVRYEEWSGKDQEYCDWIIALASHAADGVDEIWFKTEMAWSATTGPTGKYRGYFTVPNIVLDGSAANAFTFASGKWNAGSARLTGCAYLRMQFKVTGNGKKAESPFASGIPSRITIIGRGAKLYDPRRDSTVPGGSGPMRWSDQSTWRYTADDGVVIGENLPLQILFRVLGWRIRNPSTGSMKLAVGSGVPARRIGLGSFQIAANLADELVNRAAGGNEPRYHGAGVVSEGDEPKTTLDALCAACCGRFRDTNGKLSLVIMHNDLASASTDDGLNDDDVVGAFSWDPDPSLEATPNIVRGKYVDATTASLYQLIDYPEITLPSPDGQDRIFALDLGFVESPSQAQRIGKQVLQRKQYLREFSAAFDIRAWKYGVGDVVPFTFAPLGFTRALFRVKEQEHGQGSTCNMVLTFESASFYAWDADDRLPVVGADPIVYDSRNNPLILAIGEAATSALWSAVVDDDGKRPDDNANYGAPGNSPVGDSTGQEVVKALSLNTGNILGEILRGDALAAFIDARTFIDGVAIGTLIKRLQTQFSDGSTAYAQDLALLIAKTADGAGVIIRADSTYVSEGKLLVDAISTLEADRDGIKSTITDFKEILSDESGVTLRAVNVLDSNGVLTGTINEITGEVGYFDVFADVYRVWNRNGGQPVRVFGFGQDGVLTAPALRVGVFEADSIKISNIAPGFSATPRYKAPQDVAIGPNEVTLLETPFFKVGDGLGEGVANGTFSFTHDGTAVVDTAATISVYIDKGDGYFLDKSGVSGVQVTRADSRYSLFVSIPVSINALGNARIKLTGKGFSLGGGPTSGSVARNIAVDIIRVGR